MAILESTAFDIWRRIAAYLLDYFLLFVVLVPLQGVIVLVGQGFPYNLLKTGPQIELWILLSVSLPAWLYFVLSEGSARRATIGKRLFRLQVTDLRGEGIGFWRALLRTVIKLIPWELTHLTLMLPVPLWWDTAPSLRPGLMIVYGLIALYIITMFLNKRRQSVHDLVARTVVVRAGKDGGARDRVTG